MNEGRKEGYNVRYMFPFLSITTIEGGLIDVSIRSPSSRVEQHVVQGILTSRQVTTLNGE